MKEIKLPTLKELVGAGVHFGHKKQYSDARGRDNFYTIRDKIVIINLDKTRSALKSALEYIADRASNSATFLFVGTKAQAKPLVRKTAEGLNMPYVTNRWLGGTLTNFETIEKNLKNLETMEAALSDEGTSKSRTKKELTVLKRQLQSAKYNLEGIKNMNKLPDVLIVVDAAKESSALAEANITGIPVVAIADTNANPKNIAYAIPANDDAPKSLELILGLIQKTISESYKKIADNQEPTDKKNKK